MPSAPVEPPSPYASLDYRLGERPSSTEHLGPLAESLMKHTGVGFMTALSAAILLDQGSACDACVLLDREIHRMADEREQERADTLAKRVRA
jgi:hypothetical protein